MNPLISMKNIENRFGDKVVHQNLDMTLYTGEILALLGASGCGKSVLLRTLIGLVMPSRGEVLYHDKDLLKLSEADWIDVRKKIAYAFQGGALFDSLSVTDNLAYPLREHTDLPSDQIHSRIISTLKQFGLEGTERLFPSDLSGGMQKRLGVARAIMLDPEIILYDEPTAGLDPMNSRNISDMILKLRDLGKTSIVVTHDLDCVRSVADRISYIHDKKIYVTQTKEEVERNPHPLIKAYFHGEDPSKISLNGDEAQSGARS